MRGLWLESGSVSYRDDLPMPVPDTGEALVRVQMAGICGTDLALLRGYYAFQGIPGHEFSGEIISAPDAPHREGERVCGEINIACGECELCRSGRSRHCPRRSVLGIRGRHGAFAEWLCLPLNNLHTLPPDLPAEAAVFCEPLAAALRILEQTNLSPGASVLVVGAGRLGQLISAALAHHGCLTTTVARYAGQRACLEQRNLAWLAEQDVAVAYFEYVVEASGAPAGFELARRALRPCGTLVLKSTYSATVNVNLAALVVDEIQVIGSRCGAFAPALKWLSEGFDPRYLVAAQYPLLQGALAFEHAQRRGVLKVLLNCR